MIARIWHGWTTPDNADKYEGLLREGIFVGIQIVHQFGDLLLFFAHEQLPDVRPRYSKERLNSMKNPREAVARRRFRGFQAPGFQLPL